MKNIRDIALGYDGNVILLNDLLVGKLVLKLKCRWWIDNMLIWFIDDDNEEYEKLKNIIHRGIESDSNSDPYIQSIHPSDLEKDSKGEAIRENPDIILIDFQLITPEKIKEKKRLIRNLTWFDIATSVRVQYPATPIFLYSYSNLASYNQERIIADAVFDELLDKDNFLDLSSSLLDYLKIILKGYSTIVESKICEKKESESQKEILYNLLSAPSNSHDDIDSVFATLKVGKSEEWTAFDISSLIRKNLI